MCCRVLVNALQGLPIIIVTNESCLYSFGRAAILLADQLSSIGLTNRLEQYSACQAPGDEGSCEWLYRCVAYILDVCTVHKCCGCCCYCGVSR